MDWMHFILGHCLKRGSSEVPSVEISPLPLSLPLYSLPVPCPFPLDLSFYPLRTPVGSTSKMAENVGGLMSSRRGRSWSRFGYDHGKLGGQWQLPSPKGDFVPSRFHADPKGSSLVLLELSEKILLVVLTKFSEDRMFQFYIQEEGVGNQSFKHKNKQTKTIDLEAHQGSCKATEDGESGKYQSR